MIRVDDKVVYYKVIRGKTMLKLNAVVIGMGKERVWIRTEHGDVKLVAQDSLKKIEEVA